MKKQKMQEREMKRKTKSINGYKKIKRVSSKFSEIWVKNHIKNFLFEEKENNKRDIFDVHSKMISHLILYFRNDFNLNKNFASKHIFLLKTINVYYVLKKKIFGDKYGFISFNQI